MLHAGARIGAEGFGWLDHGRSNRKIPQLGRVILQDRVEIGANSAVDRGALGDTIVGENTKIDNLCQIGHNCRIGLQLPDRGDDRPRGLHGARGFGDDRAGSITHGAFDRRRRLYCACTFRRDEGCKARWTGRWIPAQDVRDVAARDGDRAVVERGSGVDAKTDPMPSEGARIHVDGHRPGPPVAAAPAIRS